MNEITVYAEVEVHSTEDPEKVRKAIENILGKAEFEEKPLKRGFILTAKTKGTEGLTKLYNLLRRERIRDAARTVFFEGINGNTITFYLNKQVAYVEHISFSQPVAESPLGPIKIQITCDNPRELIEWLAPRTT